MKRTKLTFMYIAALAAIVMAMQNCSDVLRPLESNGNGGSYTGVGGGGNNNLPPGPKIICTTIAADPSSPAPFGVVIKIEKPNYYVSIQGQSYLPVLAEVLADKRTQYFRPGFLMIVSEDERSAELTIDESGSTASYSATCRN